MAENYLYKRQNLAVEVVERAGAIINAINRLNEIKKEIAESGGGFEDTDFEGAMPGVPSLVHVNAWKMDNLINAVAPGLKASLSTTLEGSPVTYEMILLAVKR